LQLQVVGDFGDETCLPAQNPDSYEGEKVHLTNRPPIFVGAVVRSFFSVSQFIMASQNSKNIRTLV